MQSARLGVAAMAALLTATTSYAGDSSLLYQLDDGSGNVNVGPPSTFDADMLWGNYFVAQPEGRQIFELQVGLGTSYPRDEFNQPVPLTLYLFDDPDDDGDPSNAIPVAETTIVPTVFTQSGFNIAPIPPTIVDGGFFVAALIRGAVPGNESAAALDPDGSGDNSWLFYYGDANTDDLSFDIGFASEANNGAVFPFTGNWAIRANAVPAPAGAALLALTGIVGLRRRR